MKKQKKPLRGIFPALCTTFGRDGALDLDAQREAVRFVLASGANGIVCFGLAGEVNKLTPDERKQLSTVIIEEVNGRVPVLVGVGAESLYTARDLVKYVESAGADGVVGLHPMGRLGSPEDVAGAAVYFASDDSKWVTGASLAVDGGLLTQ
jgi:dihydrodipicolinate synthase/N-acetylneuraminate lyase